MKASDYKAHAALLQRVIERAKAVAAPNPVQISTLEMLRDEYDAAPQIMPVDPE